VRLGQSALVLRNSKSQGCSLSYLGGAWTARARHHLVALAIAAVTVVFAAGCSSEANSVAAQARAGDGKGYISGDGSVEQIPLASRGDPVGLDGATLEGSAWSLASLPPGTLLVLNVWGSWCGPCVAEAPELEKAWTQLQAQGRPVQFLGLDFKEGPEAGLAFQRRYGVTYPSLKYDGGLAILGLQGKAPTVPTTLVLDGSHRIAARILGQTTAVTLTGLVTDVLAQELGTGTASPGSTG